MISEHGHDQVHGYVHGPKTHRLLYKDYILERESKIQENQQILTIW